MFGRKKNEISQAPTSTISAEDLDAAADGRKGRPTPKRREAEAKLRRPLVQNDPKAARAAQRAANAEARTKMNEAMVTGDDRYLPAQHKGEQRRFIRDHIDARWSIGEFFLPIAFAFVIATFFLGSRPDLAGIILLVMYALILVALADALLAGRRVKQRLAEKHGKANVQKGAMMYAVMRTFQLRATRMPKPQVKRGQFPV